MFDPISKQDNESVDDGPGYTDRRLGGKKNSPC